ncbi:hypothetical protein RJ640_002134 [Escallonia rubra]|uniref:Actin cross-linking n=1 Tax=Escallonia rubra TaxID=112253 RepID=A0AA88QB09_9ASTE|nr:hypothetical protein RJ640_002134 [Escallonia rubra]
MEFFNKAKAVRLRSHLGKYLLADDDEETVRQTRKGASSRQACWTVELVEGKSHVVRLKSCHGRYLTASDVPFLLGMTGNKVLQRETDCKDSSVEWEPIKEGCLVKLRAQARGGKFLRANGGTPPWRNSVTQDIPRRTATKDWVLWEVDVVDILTMPDRYESLSRNVSLASSISSLSDDFAGSNSRSLSIASDRPTLATSRRQEGMAFFHKAKAVRLQSHLGKYLVADDDEKTVRQSRNGSSRKARWSVEFIEGKSNVIRLKSCHGFYLTATSEAFLLGMTGRKVLQSLPAIKMDPTIEWEPIKEGENVKLQTREGTFLRANGGTPPWRNSLTHDIPHRTATQDWVLWGVEMVDISLADADSVSSCLSMASSFSSMRDDFTGSPDTGSPLFATPRSGHTFSTRQEGMAFFHKAKAVRLQSHLGKYLVADDDEETVRQSRHGSSRKAHWSVEFIEGKSNVIRLKSCHGFYLTATSEAFLLGMTGKKVLQSLPATKMDPTIEWEPIKQGGNVKLQTKEGKFLRANGGTPPWRNSVTHDIPHRTATQDWVLWGVEVVDISLADDDSVSSCLSMASSFSSMPDDFTGSPDTGSPLVATPRSGRASSVTQSGGMEFFQKAKSVRLRSHHEKYLLADEDRETVYQDRYGSNKGAMWTVEFVEDVSNVVRLKSCFGKYLTATDEQFLLGVTGRKVLQTLPKRLDSSIEWEPIRDGFQVRLKTRYGNYLRANGGVPPWRNSITHDIPHRHTDWILWEVDLVENRPDSPVKVPPSDSIDVDLSSSSFHLRSPVLSKLESSNSFGGGSPMKSDGRMIYFHVADDDGNFDDGKEGASFQFKGHGLEELTEKLEEETGLENILVCSKNPLNGKLYPLRLSLPPNNATMNIVVLPPTSKGSYFAFSFFDTSYL